LALNGLRVSEAIGTDVDDLGLERGHHTLRIVRKGGNTVIVGLAPPCHRDLVQPQIRCQTLQPSQAAHTTTLPTPGDPLRKRPTPHPTTRGR
jgi:integrase